MVGQHASMGAQTCMRQWLISSNCTGEARLPARVTAVSTPAHKQQVPPPAYHTALPAHLQIAQKPKPVGPEPELLTVRPCAAAIVELSGTGKMQPAAAITPVCWWAHQHQTCPTCKTATKLQGAAVAGSSTVCSAHLIPNHPVIFSSANVARK